MEAETLCKRVYKSRLDRYGDNHVLTARAALALGVILQNSKNFYRGIEVFKVAVKGFETHFGIRSVEDKSKEKEARRAKKEREIREEEKEKDGDRGKKGKNPGGDGEEKKEEKEEIEEEDLDTRLARLEEETAYDSEDDSDLPPELRDARLSYENCLKMNAIG